MIKFVTVKRFSRTELFYMEEVIMGIKIDDIDFDEYHRIKKEIEKSPEILEQKIRKITSEEILSEIENGATYNLRESIQNLKRRIKYDKN